MEAPARTEPRQRGRPEAAQGGRGRAGRAGKGQGLPWRWAWDEPPGARGVSGLCFPVTRRYLRLSHRDVCGGPCRVLPEGRSGGPGDGGVTQDGRALPWAPPPGPPAAPSRHPRAAVTRGSARQAKPAPRGGEGRGRGGGVGCAPREPAGPRSPRAASRPYGLRGGGGRCRGKWQRPARRGRRLPKGAPGRLALAAGQQGQKLPAGPVLEAPPPKAAPGHWEPLPRASSAADRL